MADMQPQGEVRPHPEGEPGHEASEGLSMRGILGFAVGLVVLWLAVQLGLVRVMGHYSARETSNLKTRPPMMATPLEINGPKLQGAPARDRVHEQEIQLKHINGYGWIDRQAGIVHIPIDRAMDILAERGLPEIEDPGAAAEKEPKPGAAAEKEPKP